MSGSTYPTLLATVPLYNYLIDHIEDTTSILNVEPTIIAAANICKNKLLEYYNRTGETYLIATILDPRLKMHYYKNNAWGKKLIEENKKM
jgi:hypothetical protein